jgi:hypothetical protein
MTKTFREALTPDAAHNGARAASVTGFYGVLKAGKRVVWNSERVYRKRDYGDDARQMAIDEASSALRCDCGSLLAEELSALVS